MNLSVLAAAGRTRVGEAGFAQLDKAIGRWGPIGHATLRDRVRFDVRIDWVVGVCSFVIYLLTVAPTITWRNAGADSGDLAAAAWTLGIPHPTGYPLYSLIAAFFAHGPFGDPAHGAALFSALSVAGAVTVLAYAARDWVAQNGRGWQAALVSGAAGLQLAFAPAVWSQATIVEVYGLNLLLVSILLWSIASPRPLTRNRVFAAAGAFGLGMANHLLMVFFLPLLVLGAFRAELRKKDLAWGVLLALAPLLFYLYLPLRALTDPPINWGDPRSFGKFVWLVTAAPYRGYWFSLSAQQIWERSTYVARLWFLQFGPWGVALALWGFLAMLRRDRSLAWGLALTGALIVVSTLTYGSRDSYVYLLPAYAVTTLWIVSGLANLFAPRDPAASDQMRRFGALQLTALIPLIVFLPAFNLIVNCRTMDLTQDREAYAYAESVFKQVPQNAVVIADGDEHLFALEYYRYVVKSETSGVLVVSRELLVFDWYAAEIARRAPPMNLATTSGQASGFEREKQLLDASIDQHRAVFLTVPDASLLAQYVCQQEGSLTRVMREK